MRWVGWAVSPSRPTNCEQCRRIAKANRKRPHCDTCQRPPRLSTQNQTAWELWSLLDTHGREFDTMGGNPLPLRLEAIAVECGKSGDPDGMEWRVLLIDSKILEYRREQRRREASKK